MNLKSVLFVLAVFCFIQFSEQQELKSPYRLSPVVRRIISTKNAPGAIGPYNQAIQVGATLYVSGNIGLDPKNGTIVPGGIGPETNQALMNMGYILQEAGCGFESVVKTDILLANISDFATVNDIYQMYFKKSFPARVTYQVGALPKGALVEIDAIAVVGDIVDV